MFNLMNDVIIYISVFFFFKQKTAYEMRISDWSSDVCSSDLFGRSPVGVLIEIEPALIPRGDAGDRERVAQIDRAGERHRPGAGVAAEIGRASCRERVCQYV